MAQLDSAIENLIRWKKDLENYDYIIRQYKTTDISTDLDFQRKYTYFYKIRRNAEWRKKYYAFFEKSKYNSDINFEFILRSIFELTGRIEASFASKLLATIKPEMPIWDSIVLSKLHIKPSQNPDQQERLKETIAIYGSICSWYNRFQLTDENRDFISAFDAAFPDFTHFSRVKKIDFLIWGSKDSEMFDVGLLSNNITAQKKELREQKHVISDDEMPHAAQYALIEADNWFNIVLLINKSSKGFDQQICVLSMHR